MSNIKDKNDNLIRDVKSPSMNKDEFVEIAGFEPRPNQLELVNHLLDVILNKLGISVFEGMTGFGKTLIGIAVVVFLLQRKEFKNTKVVIAPHTNGLQIQWCIKLRDIIKKLGLSFSIALLFGKKKYMCNKKLMNLKNTIVQEKVKRLKARLQTDKQSIDEDFKPLTRMYATSRGKHGRDALTMEEFDTIMCDNCFCIAPCQVCKCNLKCSKECRKQKGEKITYCEECIEYLCKNHCDLCKKIRCDHCERTKAVEIARNSNIVIMNQDLLRFAFMNENADWLNLTNNSTSSPIVIVDEAHELPRKLKDDAKETLNLNKINDVVHEIVNCEKYAVDIAVGAMVEVEISYQLQEFEKEIFYTIEKTEKYGLEVKTTHPEEWQNETKDVVRKLYANLFQLQYEVEIGLGLRELDGTKKRRKLNPENNFDPELTNEAKTLYSKLKKMCNMFKGLVSNLDEETISLDSTQCIYFVSNKDSEWILTKEPIDSGQTAHDKILSTPLGKHLILMSATLRDSNSRPSDTPRLYTMDGFLSRMGLLSPWFVTEKKENFKHLTFVVPNDFSYKTRVRFKTYTASTGSLQMCQYLTKEIKKSNCKKAGLILCNSEKNQIYLYEHIRKTTNRTCYFANSNIDTTMEQLEADPTTLVFGTKTYYTGIDYCRWGLVFMDKVPFQKPLSHHQLHFYIKKKKTKEIRALREELERMELSQGFGRLMRQDICEGRFALCKEEHHTLSFFKKFVCFLKHLYRFIN